MRRVARILKRECIQNFSHKTSKNERKLGRSRRRWKNNIKEDLRETRYSVWTEFIWVM